MMAKFGPLPRSEDCAGVSGLDDKLMTHLLLEPIDVSGLLLLAPVVVVVVVMAVVVMVAECLVVVVIVSPLLSLFCVCDRTTLVVLLSMDREASIIGLMIMLVSTFSELSSKLIDLSFLCFGVPVLFNLIYESYACKHVIFCYDLSQTCVTSELMFFQFF